MNQYNPMLAPAPKAWKALDEQERIDMVEAYHDRAGVALPNPRLHATLHVVVENQVALGDETPIRGELARLMREGLDRHQAVHAVGTVLAGMMFNMLQGDSAEGLGEPNEKLFDEVRELTAEKWFAMGRENDD